MFFMEINTDIDIDKYTEESDLLKTCQLLQVQFLKCVINVFRSSNCMSMISKQKFYNLIEVFEVNGMSLKTKFQYHYFFLRLF